jgi:hypothetical protein
VLSRLVERFKHVINPHEAKALKKEIARTKHLSSPTTQQLEMFLRCLRENGATQEQLVYHEYDCIHCNEQTPQEFLLNDSDFEQQGNSTIWGILSSIVRVFRMS